MKSNITDRKLPWADIVMASLLIPLISFMTMAFNSPKDVNHDPKTDLYWLIGTWENKDEAGTFEKWDYGVNALTGKGYKLEKDKEVLLESLSITSQGHTLFYHVDVVGQNDGKTVTFKLTRAGENSFTFTNPQHDFPKEITYKKISSEEFQAIVSDGAAEKPKSFTVTMKKVK